MRHVSYSIIGIYMYMYVYTEHPANYKLPFIVMIRFQDTYIIKFHGDIAPLNDINCFAHKASWYII